VSALTGWRYTVSAMLPAGTVACEPQRRRLLPDGWDRLDVSESIAAAIRAGVPLWVSPDVGDWIRRSVVQPGMPGHPDGATLRRCVGAFRRVCLALTDAILCPACWAEVERIDPKGRAVFPPPRPPLPSRAVRLPVRGTVE
jgi:hypothetical protein